MTVIFIVLPLALLLSAVAVGGYVWSTKSGQLDDLDTPPLRVLGDELAHREPERRDPSLPPVPWSNDSCAARDDGETPAR